MGRLERFGKFAVAVIDEGDDRRICGLDRPDGGADLFDRQTLAVGIAAAALDMHHPHATATNAFGDGGMIELVIPKVDLLIADAVCDQTVAASAGETDDALQGIIRSAGDAKEGIAVLEEPAEGDGEGVGAGHQLYPDKGVLRAEYAAVDAFEFFSAAVIVTVAGDLDKIGGGDALLLKSAQDGGAPLHTNGIDRGEPLGAIALGACGKRRGLIQK